jgi:uncharacterized membrane protein YphA (DoxX/SURF4 family)
MAGMAASATVGKMTLHALRIAIGGVFVWAGALKAWDPAAFADAIDRYRMFPHAVSAAIALYLPYLEITAGAAVLVRWAYRPAVLSLMLLVALFTVAILWAFARGLAVRCGCFGPRDQTPLPLAAIRNAVLMAALICLLLTSRRTTLTQLSCDSVHRAR